jgi:hypothetical protein
MSEPNKSSNSFKGMLWEAQPGRNVFLQFDDRLGAPLSRLPREVLAPRLRKVRGRRVWFVGFAASRPRLAGLGACKAPAALTPPSGGETIAGLSPFQRRLRQRSSGLCFGE